MKNKIKSMFLRLANSLVKILPNRLSKYLNELIGLTYFKRISIPLVRRIYPQLIVDKLVNIQPMKEPTSVSLYLKFKYSSKEK